jgi:hypothetical protein
MATRFRAAERDEGTNPVTKPTSPAPEPYTCPRCGAVIHNPRTPTAEPSDAILTPKETAQHLWECWRLQRGERRLAQLRAGPVGSGPAFHRDGCVVRYRKSSVDTWAMKQLGREHGSTSHESAWEQTASAEPAGTLAGKIH